MMARKQAAAGLVAVGVCIALPGCRAQRTELPEVGSGKALDAYQLIAAISRQDDSAIDDKLAGRALEHRDSIISELRPEGCQLRSVRNFQTPAGYPQVVEGLNVLAGWDCPSRDEGVTVEIAVTEAGTISGIWRSIEH